MSAVPASLTELATHRDLLLAWTLREVRVRYKQSALGAAWAVLQPLSLTAVFTVVFSFFVKVPTDGIPYPVFAYTAMLPWTLFTTAVGSAAPSLVNNSQLVGKIYFPREVLPLGAIGAALVDFSIAAVLYVGLMALYGVPATASLLWVPLLLLVQMALTVGLSLAASAVNVYYRDIRFVIPLVLQIWMYASPIIYPITLVPEWLRPLYLLNPMAGILCSYRRVALQGQAPVTAELLPAVLISTAVLVLGYICFKRLEPNFADVL